LLRGLARTRPIVPSEARPMTRSPASRLLPLLLGALAPFVASGCGQGPPPVSASKTEATVRGKVVVRGKAATKGQVVFDPSNIRRKDAVARTAELNPDGTYSITTLIGENDVRYEGPAIAGDRELDGISLGILVEE